MPDINTASAGRERENAWFYCLYVLKALARVVGEFSLYKYQ